MSDPTKAGGPPRAPSGSPENTFERVGEAAKAGAADLTSKARDAAGGVRAESAGLVQDLKAEGASVAGAVQDRASGFAEEQKRAGAEQAQGVARAVHRAADELQGTSPQIARYVHEAASSLDDLGRALRERSPGDLINGMEGLARRQPVAFFGAAVLAGFALARFAKSSAKDAPRPAAHDVRPVPAEPPPVREARAADVGGGNAPPRDAATGAPGWVSGPGRGGEPGPKPATTAAASLGGAAARTAGGRAAPENRNS